MKNIFKKLLIALPIILVFATISSSVPNKIKYSNYPSETTIQNVSDSRQKSNNLNTEYSLKMSLEKEVAYHESIYKKGVKRSDLLRVNKDTPDQYEGATSNNFIQFAYNLTQKPIGSPTDYSFSINATLHINSLFGIFDRDIDVDYYRFDVFANANVSIELKNIASNLDYALELYIHDNIEYAGTDDVTRIDYSNRTGNSNEEITIYLTPGTYYLKVYSVEGHSASEEYNLSCKVITTRSNADLTSISYLRYNKGAGAAIWISDFDPYGIEPLSTYANVKVGYTDDITYISAGQKHDNPFFSNIPLVTNIPHTILYIWDLGVRQELYDALNNWKNVLEAQIQTNTNLRITLETILTTINGVVSIVSASLSLEGISVPGLTLVSPLAAILLRILFPDAWDTTKEGLLDYVRILLTALDYYGNTSSNEIVKIPVTYKLTTAKELTIFGLIDAYYCDFTPQYNTDGYLHKSEYISNYQNGGIFGGQVYGIRKYSDFEAAFNRRTTALEDVNTGGNTQITLQSETMKYLNKGEYHWYNFTAPVRAEYTFYTEGITDTYGELFANIVPALSTIGRYDYSNGGGTQRNFSLSRVLNASETIYLRVSSFLSSSSGLYHVKVSQGDIYQSISQTIVNSDYGFEGQYYFDQKTKDITLDNGFTFQTNRLRTGYIYDNMITQNSYLALSAKRKNAGLAYLEYYFEDRVFEIDFDIGLWSANESLNSGNSTVKLEYLVEENWKTGINFIVDTLPKSKDNLAHFTYTFEKLATAFRFIVTANSVTSNSNKGRVVIGDVNVKY